MHNFLDSNIIVVMKVIDDLLAKIGTDKCLHFFGGGFLCAIMTLVCLLQDGVFTNRMIFGSVLIGTIAVIFVSVIKEIADGKFDWKDILAAILGCVAIGAAAGVGVLFNYWS